ncbi:MAG: carboxypeptidase regulatory-like domain-containing protein [Terracidiphilus sp.]
MSGYWLLLSSALCLTMYDCGPSSRFAPRKPDATKGTVTGTVFCTDTGKPARFAAVTLLLDPSGPKESTSSELETTETDLDGRFKIEAVAPGRYFAFATLEGYLDPEYGLEFEALGRDADGSEKMSDVVDQWKEHMVEISVRAQQATDVSIEIERGAEIAGRVSYDDGPPAIGIRFAFYRHNAKSGWSLVGPLREGSFTLQETSDSHGRFAIPNLPAGEYIVCAVIPGDAQASSPQICLGNVFRKRDARSISVGAGDAVNGADILIPLRAIHSIAGSLVQVATDQPPIQAKLSLLYSDDREVAMSTPAFSDGTFLFPFVPEGTYILQVSDANYTEPPAPAGSTESGASPPAKVHQFANREVAVTVDGDVKDLAVGMVETTPQKPAAHQVRE